MRITRNQPVSPEKLEAARALRRAMTREERIVWQALRTEKFETLHFRRQQVIAGFIVDFYYASARMAVELDGPPHLKQKDYDQQRDRALCDLGITTLRIKNESVRADLDAVLQTIIHEAKRLLSDHANHSSRPPLLKGEGTGER
jgi:very-short-patch-repair endonuclease